MVKQVAKDVFVTPYGAGPVIGAEGKLMRVRGEHLLQLGRRASACGAKDHACLAKCVDALEEALGESAIVGKKRLVHIDGEQLDVTEVGVLEIVWQHGVLSFDSNAPSIANTSILCFRRVTRCSLMGKRF